MRMARERIRELPDVRAPFVCSTIYETEPVGCERGAGSFLNAAVEFEFHGDPAHLLRELRRIEAALGRQLEHAPNASRTIDLDLLYCGGEQINTAELQLPHPRLAQRRFVLQPLADIRPSLILPGQFEPVTTLLERLPTAPAVVRFREQW